ncbi:MAG: transcription antitermination factor NusB [Bacteroidales bacterium]|nr:transcription antitermination factor NusB [Bacteroidales bacterium]
MLSRRHLRVKVLQALYAFFQSDGNDLADGEKQLVKSADKLYELYIYQLAFLISLVDFILNRMEEGKKKFYPTEEDLHPNTRLIENALIKQIAENKDFLRWKNRLKVNWSGEINLFHKFYQELKSGEDYLALVHSEDTGYKADKELLTMVVSNYLADYEMLRSYYEDLSIYWSDEDYDISLVMLLKTIQLYREQWSEEHGLPSLFKTEDEFDGDDEDRKYMLKLFRHAILRSEDYAKLVEDQAVNWEVDRIAVMDMIILKMALTELTVFPSIPVKVTINEYIEISKSYSSVKSKLFINGILDKLVVKLKNEGKIIKMGRGLME